MAFVIPENLHEELYPLAWMIGTWAGTGRCEYPGIEPFDFAQEVSFNHDGRNFLNYYSRTWKIDENKDITEPFEFESGFWSVRDKKILEVVIAQSIGINQGWVGIVDGAKIQLALDKSYSAQSASLVDTGQRLYGNVEGELFYAYDMGMNGHDLQAYMWSSLARKVD
ncbi:MAG: FABP family protein [Actinomycetes bacterium]